MTLRSSLLIAILIVVAVACGGGTPGTSGSTNGGSASGSTPPPAPAGPAGNAACLQGTKLGQPGVITIICDGTAVLKVSGAANGQISGGRCSNSGGLLVANAGIATDHNFQGQRPNFLSVNTPPGGGGGQDTAATVIMDGKFFGDSGRFGGTATVSSDQKTIQFKGSASNGDQVAIDVTC